MVIRTQDIFKTFCKNVLKTFWRRLEDVLKTSWRRFDETSWKRLQKHFQDVFKTYHQVKLLLLTRLKNIFKTYLPRFLEVLPSRLSTERFALVILLINSRSEYKIFKNELFRYTKTFETLYEVTRYCCESPVLQKRLLS